MNEPVEQTVWSCPMCGMRFDEKMFCERHIESHTVYAKKNELIGRWIGFDSGPIHTMMRVAGADNDKLYGPSLRTWEYDGQPEFEKYDWCLVTSGYEVIGGDDEARARWNEMVDKAMVMIKEDVLRYFDACLRTGRGGC